MDNVKGIDANTVLEGKIVNSLYILTSNEAFMEKTSRQDNAFLWHARLAHMSYDKLKNISANTIVKGLPNLEIFHHDIVCDGCQFRKAHHLPFRNSSVRSKRPLELIHSNLLTNNEVSYSDLRYMLVTEDEYIRFTGCSS